MPRASTRKPQTQGTASQNWKNPRFRNNRHFSRPQILSQSTFRLSPSRPKNNHNDAPLEDIYLRDFRGGSACLAHPVRTTTAPAATSSASPPSIRMSPRRSRTCVRSTPVFWLRSSRSPAHATCPSPTPPSRPTTPGSFNIPTRSCCAPPISWSTPATIDNARDMQRFVMHLAAVYRLTGDPRYAQHPR